MSSTRSIRTPCEPAPELSSFKNAALMDTEACAAQLEYYGSRPLHMALTRSSAIVRSRKV